MRRRRFVLVYVAVAAIGAVAAFFGAPLVRASIAPERLADMIMACRSETPIADLFSAALASRIRQPEAPVLDRPPGPQPRIPRPAAGAPPSPEQPRQAAATTGRTASTATQTPPAGHDYSAMWAVVTNETAAVYDSSGSLAQELAAGTLVEVASVRNGTTEGLAICRYDTKPKSMDIAIIRTRDLLIRKGSLESASADLVALVRKQVHLDIEIRTLIASRESELAKNNPHAGEYSAARSAVLSFNERAKVLRAKADKANGSERVDAMDKLRSMKEEEVVVRRNYDSARRAFEDWNRLHGGSAADSEPVKALRERLADVRTRIARMDSN